MEFVAEKIKKDCICRVVVFLEFSATNRLFGISRKTLICSQVNAFGYYHLTVLSCLVICRPLYIRD